MSTAAENDHDWEVAVFPLAGPAWGPANPSSLVQKVWSIDSLTPARVRIRFEVAIGTKDHDTAVPAHGSACVQERPVIHVRDVVRTCDSLIGEVLR